MSAAVTEQVMHLSDTAPAARRSHAVFDRSFRVLCMLSAATVLLVLIGILGSIAYGGWPAFREFGIGFLFTATWNPVTEVYGAAGPIVGLYPFGEGGR